MDAQNKKKKKGQALSQPIPRRKSRTIAPKPIGFQEDTSDLGNQATNVEKPAADIIEVTDLNMQGAIDKSSSSGTFCRKSPKF